MKCRFTREEVARAVLFLEAKKKAEKKAEEKTEKKVKTDDKIDDVEESEADQEKEQAEEQEKEQAEEQAEPETAEPQAGDKPSNELDDADAGDGDIDQDYDDEDFNDFNDFEPEPDSFDDAKDFIEAEKFDKKNFFAESRKYAPNTVGAVIKLLERMDPNSLLRIRGTDKSQFIIYDMGQKIRGRGHGEAWLSIAPGEPE